MTSIIDEIRAEFSDKQPDGSRGGAEAGNTARLSGKKRCFANVSNVEMSASEILGQLLEEIEPVDFAGFAGGEEVRAVHHRICSVKNIVHLAKHKGWGVCKKNGNVYVYTGAHWRRVDPDDMKAFLGAAALRSGVPRYRADDYKFRKDFTDGSG